MAANGLTPDGQLERLSIEAEMAQQPGWRGTTLRWLFRLAALVAIVLIAIYVLNLVRGFGT